ncbi:MAG: sterol desaturase family protein [Bacteriovoracia bacterium]
MLSSHGIPVYPLWLAIPLMFFIVGVRYLIFAGGAYLYFYVWKREALHRYKIDPVFPNPKLLKAEFKWSVVTSLLFGVAGALVSEAWEAGYTRIYWDIAEYGWFYLFFSVFLMMFIHDTYFYFTHVLIHHPKLFKRVHKVHHDSVNPSPWAAFSFHPWEGLIEAIALPLIIFIVPVHPIAFVSFLMIMTVLGVINHMGYEVMPKWFATHWFGKWFITATHHFQHHRLVKCNYGLYFTFWDRLLGTERADYPKFYAQVKAKGEAPTPGGGATLNPQTLR